MSEFVEPVNQRELDRMVDGELTEEEQQALLRRVDGAGDDSWKLLALTFLETQILGGVVRELAGEVDEPSQTKRGVSATRDRTSNSQAAGIVPGVSRPAQWRRLLPRWFAAGFLFLTVGFGIGRFSVPEIVVRDVAPAPELAGPASPQPIPESTDRELASQELANPEFASPELVFDEPSPSDVTGTPNVIRLVFGDGVSDIPRTVDVPVSLVSKTTPAEFTEFLASERLVVPPQLIQTLRDAGQKVEYTRTYWQLPLPDGRAAVIPVSQVRLVESAPVYP